MTMVSDNASPAEAAPPTVAPHVAGSGATTWQAVQAGLWIGRRDGEFAGMIEELWGKGYQVTTRLGKTLGTFRTMEEAQSSLR